MKNYLKDIVNKLKNYSEKLDNFTLLIDQPWIIQSEENSDRCLFIFRKENKELFILTNGIMKKEDEGAIWDYIAPMNSLLIRRNGESRLFNQGFFDESIMILKLDGTNEFQLFANENKIESTIEKLVEKVERRYIKVSKVEKNIFTVTNEEILYKTKFWSGKYTEIKLKFSTGNVGSIFKDDSGYYMYDQTGWNRLYYRDKESVVNALYSILHLNKMDYEGFIRMKP